MMRVPFLTVKSPMLQRSTETEREVELISCIVSILSEVDDNDE